MAESHIENDEPSDQVGCVRNFTLKDGNHIREQLLALSDRDYVSTYCILDATLPMQHYVATVQLKRVTDGDRTFWHWQSTFDVPRGREQEFADLVGEGVYEGGFEGLRAFLRRGARRRAAAPLPARWPGAGASSRRPSAAPRSCSYQAARSPRRPGRARCASARPRSASTTSTSTCARACTA